MALNSNNVRVAVTGALSVGSDTAVAPIDADTALGIGWGDLGYVSEDGVTETRDRSTNTIRGWQNGDVLREVVTEASVSYQAVLVETKKETVELFYATTVDTTDGSLVVVPAKTGGRKPYVLDVIDGDEFIRAYIPAGEITEVGDQVYANGEPVGYEVTIRAYPDASLLDADGNAGSVKKWYSSLAVPPAWASSTAYTVGDRVTLTGGAVLEATVGGTSAATAPTAPGAVGGTVTDGTVTWKRIS